MMHTAKVALCSDTRTKHMNTLYGQNVELFLFLLLHRAFWNSLIITRQQVHCYVLY
jgi:hypothetical protein